MLGLLLNCFKNVKTQLNSVLEIIPEGQYHFGLKTNASDYTVSSDLSGSDLANATGQTRLLFKNLTVAENASVYSNNYKNPANWAGLKLAGDYAPLIIQCKEKLIVNGAIHADGCGIDNITGGDRDVNIYSNERDLSLITSGYAGPLFAVTNHTMSTTVNIYQNIINYGANVGFFNSQCFFMGTSGGSTLNTLYDHISRGISSGSGNASTYGGGSGGLVFLYFNKLTADVMDINLETGLPYVKQVEYGVDQNFPVERICANGIGGDCGTSFSAGGGMVVLSAPEIHIGLNGRVSSNAILPSGVTQTGTNYSFLNNVPQLADNQTGYYWDPNTKDFVYGSPQSRIYYYSDGTDFSNCNQSINTASSATLCGGAGMACGVKVGA